MPEFIRHVLLEGNTCPTGCATSWDPVVLWLSVISDSLIAAAYYAIPFLMFSFMRKRRDVDFKGIFVPFAVFILACGTTSRDGRGHGMEPALPSGRRNRARSPPWHRWPLFAMLIPLMPALIALPSPSQMARANLPLSREVAERRTAEEKVRRINEELERARRHAHRRAGRLKTSSSHSQKTEAVSRYVWPAGWRTISTTCSPVIPGYNQNAARARVSQDGRVQS